jgi:solute carrier family 39 (zinc transporter), member 7
VLGGEDDGHGHSHTHTHSHSKDSANGVTSALDAPSKEGLRSRTPNVTSSQEQTSSSDVEQINATSKLS